jgi:hypothetical protein
MTDETLRERIGLLRFPPYRETINRIGQTHSQILADVLDELLTRVRQLEQRDKS